MPRGGKSFISMPVDAGDIALVVFADHCIDGIIDGGEPANPPFERTHDLNDGIAICGIFPQNDPVSPGDPDHVSICDPEKITLTAPDVEVIGEVFAKKIHSGNGYTGTFTTSPSRTVTVENGVVTGVT
jgi:hypothetical protein